MSTGTVVAQPVTGAARFALLIAGLAAIAFGIAVLVWPDKAIFALTAVIAIYAIVTGVAYAGTGIFAKGLGAGGRIGHVLLGVLFVIAGIVALTSLQQSAVFLAIFITVMLGVLWIMEGFVALFTLGKSSGSKFLTIAFAILSIVAGAVLVLSPVWSAVFLWWFVGIALVVLGIVNVVRAIIGRVPTIVPAEAPAP